MYANLPRVLEIPHGRIARGTVRVPGSKSLTQRALVVAALAHGVSRIVGGLDSDDSRALRIALRRLGAEIGATTPRGRAPARRGGQQVWIVRGTGGRLRPVRAPLRVGNAGTAMRFLTALVALGSGRTIVDGDRRMHQRPIGDLVAALRRLGADARCPRRPGYPPVEIRAAGEGGLPGGETRIEGATSSQYLSGLLMAAPLARRNITIRVSGKLVSAPYVNLTLQVMRDFGAKVRGSGHPPRAFRVPGSQSYRARSYRIEGDASSASYFLAAAAITGGRVRVANLRADSRQGDAGLASLLARMGCRVKRTRSGIEVAGPPAGPVERRGGSGGLRGIGADMSDMPDVVPTLAVVALFARTPTRIRGAAHLRVKETDRLAALAREIARLGGSCRESADGLVISPRPLRAALIRTYEDHRMAMAFSLVGLRVPGVRIQNPACVRKSFPDYFTRLFRLLKSPSA